MNLARTVLGFLLALAHASPWRWWHISAWGRERFVRRLNAKIDNAGLEIWTPEEVEQAREGNRRTAGPSDFTMPGGANELTPKVLCDLKGELIDPKAIVWPQHAP